MNKKYRFTGKEIEHFGRKLKQIERIVDGLLGGYIESENNLDHSGDAWVYGDARVYGNARVYDNAWVSGNARVYGDAWVYGDARVYGNAKIKTNKDYINIIIHPYNITITKTYIQIGCESKTYDNWMKVTKRQAISLGLGKDYFTVYKSVISALYEQYFGGKK